MADVEELRRRIAELEAQLKSRPRDEDTDDEEEEEDEDYYEEDEDDESDDYETYGDEDEDEEEKAIIQAVVDGDEFTENIIKAIRTGIRAQDHKIAELAARVDELSKATRTLIDVSDAIAKAVECLPALEGIVKSVSDSRDLSAKTTPAPSVSVRTGVTPLEKSASNGTVDKALMKKALDLYPRAIDLNAHGANIPLLDAWALDHGQVTNDELTAFIKAVEAAQ